jgi:arylformamidase
MKIIDISWPISAGMTSYKDRFKVAVQAIKEFKVDGVRESCVTLNAHSGTHVDAPSHFISDGMTIETLALEKLMGTCLVLDCTAAESSITQSDLVGYDSVINKNDIVLLKTANSDRSSEDLFNPDFVYLAHSGALYLRQKGVKAVGIDYLGIERAQPDHATHLELMNADIPIIEGLRLATVTPGRYHFICLPLHIVGMEAAPARAILIQND